MACSGGCGKCKICKGSPIVRAAKSSSYKRGLCRNHGIPPFATKSGYCLLPNGGAGETRDSFLALDVCNAIEAEGKRTSLWSMTYLTCSSIKQKFSNQFMKSKRLAHEQITQNIEAYVDKAPDETWTKWGRRQIQGGD